MRGLGRDLHDGIRAFRKSAGFSLAVVTILALAIGGNVAVFTIVDAALWRPLPYPRPERLVALPASHRGGDMGAEVSVANFLDWRRELRSFESLGAWSPASFNAGPEPGGAGPAERLRGATITAGGLTALGVRPVVGRLFSAGEEGPESRAAILSYGLWKSRFAGARDVVGREIRLGGVAHEVVGVMPPDFRFPDSDVRVWVPLRLTARRMADRQSRWLYAFGRLAAGASVAGAQREVDAVSRALEERHPATNTGWSARAVPLSEQASAGSKRVLGILLATVAAVLAVACANVANLQLARSAGRRRELAIRAALGASARDLVRQLFVEGAVLALLGGAAGALLARAAVPLLARAAAGALPRIEEARLDGRVLLFVLAISAAVAVFFGLAGARAVWNGDLAEPLQESRGGSPRREATRLRRLLTGGEIAAALVLTVVAVLLVASLGRILAVPAGLDPRGVLTVETVLSPARYPDDARRSAYFRALVERVRSVPGVEAAAGISTLPLTGANATESYAIDGRPPAAPGRRPEAGLRVVTPGYFSTLRIPLLAGRDFGPSDRAPAPGVVIVNRTFAEREWPGEDPLGRRIRMDDGRGEPHEVIGVVGDVHHSRLEEPAVPEIYVGADQHPSDSIVLLVRSRLAAASLVPRVSAEAAAIDPEQPLFGAATMERVVGDSVARPRLYAVVLSAFAGLALLLSVLGIASLAAYSVAQRLRELAIRAALGAAPRDLRLFVLADAMTLTGAGIGVGLAGAVAVSRALAGVLFEVAPADPRVLAGAAAVLGLAALAASLGPAVRASRVDPVAALRGD